MAAVVSAYPEIGEDVDKPSDLEAVRRFWLRSKGVSSSWMVDGIAFWTE